MDIKIINQLIKLNNKAKISGDIPVSCIIMKNNQIISKGYNKKYKNKDPLAHAEIIAIRKATKKLNTTNLCDCELFVTLEPCNMCKEVIKEARIKKIYFILNQEKSINNNAVYKKINNDYYDYFLNELKDFFINKR